jgi:predicted RNA-binding protein with PIN domain
LSLTYLIDGYNLIFCTIDPKESIQSIRESVISAIRNKFRQLKVSGIIVFDGNQRKGEVGSIIYSHPLVVAYTAKGQTADHYIVDEIERARNPKLIIVVTNDKGLALHVRSHGAQVESIEDFLESIKHRSKKRRKKELEPRDTQQNIDRLLKIFEKRLEEGTD